VYAKIMKAFLAVILAVLAGLSLLLGNGCGPAKNGGKEGAPIRLNGAGSSFIKPMMDEWARVYRDEQGVEVNYQSKGSSTGIEEMTDQAIDFGCADAPLNEQQIQRARARGGEVVHIPLVMGAVVPVYNLPPMEKPLHFSGPMLADIFRRSIRRWNDEAIRKLNPDAPLPDQNITVLRRADGSGTNYIFTEYLSKVSPEWRSEVGFWTSVNWPKGTIGERGNEGVSKGVKETPGAIGYVELVFALKIHMAYGAVQNRAGKFIHADLASVEVAAKTALTIVPEDLRFSLTDAPGEAAYPITGTVWAICYVNQPADKVRALVDFLRWITHQGQSRTAALYYARLPAELIPPVEKKLGAIRPLP
jgi:phosphate transport system substrate-binding protein